MLLLSVGTVFAGFVVPAFASADSWADNGVALAAGEQITQSYEGFVQFNTGPTGAFGCQVTVTMMTNGPNAAQITKFSPTTSTCEGTTAFKGCKLVKDSSNLPWDVSSAATPLVVTRAGGNITFHNEYEAGTCTGKQTTSHLEFKEVKLAVEGTNPITKLTVSGKSTAGISLEGSLIPEGTATLGILPPILPDAWADNGVVIAAGAEVAQSYEGFVGLNAGAAGTFGCEITITVRTNGPHAATVTKFAPTTSSCVGTVAFKGCKLINDSSDVPWNLSNAATPLVMSKASVNITTHSEYEAGSCAGKQTTSHLEFASFNVAVEGTDPIKKITISGVSTAGIPWGGSLTAETPETLGLAN